MANDGEHNGRTRNLTEAERQELADQLFQSTLPEAPGEHLSAEDAEAAWIEVIKRRLEQVDRGEVELKDAFQALEEGRRKLHEARDE